MNKLTKLRARLAEVREEMRTIAETDADELTEEQESRFAELERELEHDEDGEARGLLADIAREEKRAALLEKAGKVNVGEPGADAKRSVPNVNTKTDPFGIEGVPSFGSKRDAEMRARALDVIERGGRFVSDAHRKQATAVVERMGYKPGVAELTLLRASDRYADAFLRTMAGDDLTVEDRQALDQVRDLQRAMALSDVTGVLVPSHLDPTVILSNDGTINPFRRISRVVQHNTNVWTGVTSAGVTASWDAEAAEASDDAPSFSNPTVTAYKANAFVPISYEAYEDLRGGEDDIVRMIVEEKDRLESVAFATGNGTSAPRGIVTALDANTNVEVATTTSNVFGLVDVYNVYEQLPARWRQNAQWVANLAIINDIRQFGTDSLSTQTVDLTADGVTRILGKPVNESAEMDGTIGVAGTDDILIVGDFSQYLIADRIGLAVEFIPNLFGTTNARPTGQRGWMAHWRTGANSLVDTAFRLLQAETNS